MSRRHFRFEYRGIAVRQPSHGRRAQLFQCQNDYDKMKLVQCSGLHGLESAERERERGPTRKHVSHATDNCAHTEIADSYYLICIHIGNFRFNGKANITALSLTHTRLCLVKENNENGDACKFIAAINLAVDRCLFDVPFHSRPMRQFVITNGANALSFINWEKPFRIVSFGFVLSFSLRSAINTVFSIQQLHEQYTC